MFNTRKRTGWVAAATVLLLLGASGTAFAIGTPAGTPVNNSATVTYSVNTVGQTPIESSETGNTNPGVGNGTPTGFLVDRKVDVLVLEVGNSFTFVSPGQANQVLTYSVQNLGNAVEDFALTAIDGTGNTFTLGGVTETDDFDATAPSAPSIYIDDGGTVGVWDATDTEVAYLDNVAVDSAAQTVFVVRNMPADRIDGAASFITLDAQAVAETGSPASPGAPLVQDTGVQVANTVQIVFADRDGSLTGGADGLRDGRHSAVDGYVVQSAQLTVTKSATVIRDPFGNANPKAIPGSIVEYEIRIDNVGASAQTATNITISDDLSAQISAGPGLPGITYVFDEYGSLPAGSGEDMQLVTDQSGSSVTSVLSAAADADAGQFVGNVVTVNNLSLGAGRFVLVRFRVLIE